VSETAKILGTLDKSLGAACKLVESFLDTEELIKSDPSSSAAPLLDFRRYENPAIQRFYSVLQAVALMEESPDWTAEKDTLRPIPALAQPTGKYEQAVMGFKEAFGLDDSVLAAAEGGKKRLAAAAGVGGGGGRGRAKGSAVTSGAGGGDNGEGGDGEEANGGGGGGKAKKVKAEAGAEMTEEEKAEWRQIIADGLVSAPNYFFLKNYQYNYCIIAFVDIAISFIRFVVV
jgi:hypothetical protein